MTTNSGKTSGILKLTWGLSNISIALKTFLGKIAALTTFLVLLYLGYSYLFLYKTNFNAVSKAKVELKEDFDEILMVFEYASRIRAIELPANDIIIHTDSYLLGTYNHEDVKRAIENELKARDNAIKNFKKFCEAHYLVLDKKIYRDIEKRVSGQVDALNAIFNIMSKFAESIKNSGDEKERLAWHNEAVSLMEKLDDDAETIVERLGLRGIYLETKYNEHYERDILAQEAIYEKITISTIFATFVALITGVALMLIIGRGHASQMMIVENEERYRKYITNAPDGVFVVDKQGRYVEVNDATCEATGYTRTELLGMFMLDIVSEEHRTQVKEYFHTLITTGNLSKQVALNKKDGSMFYIQLDAIDLGNGRYIGFSKDISKSKLTEEILYKQAWQMRILQEVTAETNEARTAEDAMRTCLKKVCESAGWEVGHVYIPDENGVCHPSDIWVINSDEKFEVFRQITMDTVFPPGKGLPGRICENSEPAWIVDVTKDKNFPRGGKGLDIGVKGAFAFPVLEGKKVSAVLEFFTTEPEEVDQPLMETIKYLATQVGRVTERKRAEKRLKESHIQLQGALQELEKAQNLLVHSEKMAALGQLSAGVAHEIRNPLNIISTAIQLLTLDGELTPEVAKTTKIVHEQVKRATKITDNLREFAREKKPEKLKIDLCKFIDRTVSLMEYEMSLENINVVRNFHQSPINILGDEDQLAQVLLNIIGNARDSMNEKQTNNTHEELKQLKWEGRLVLEAYVEDGMGVAEFSDTGIGVPPEVQVRLFDPFFTTKPEDKGTGLGLSIAHGIVENHGGKIAFDSKPGEGFTMKLYIPLAPYVA